MGNLTVSMRNASAAMGIYQRAMSLVQSNVTNASTPGYARQSQILTALPTDVDHGLSGGLASGGTLNSRDERAEDFVRKQIMSLGYASQLATSLSSIEPSFTVTQGQGIAGALNTFFTSASALTVSPNDAAARQTFLTNASALARSFNATASGLTDAATTIDANINDSVTQINSLLNKLQQMNKQYMENSQAQQDSGLEANLHSTLEDLSQYVDFSMLRDSNGAVSIAIGGQVPALMSDRVYPLSVNIGATQDQILDAQGNDITSKLQGGALTALVETRNVTIAGYQTQLDQLAASVADTVNTQLSQGLDQTGNAPVTNLFTYNAALGAARTIATNTLQTGDLALASTGAPGGNGNAIALAGLADQKTINGYTFTQFYGSLAAQVGADVSAAQGAKAVATSLTNQAQTLRDQSQKVNLDEEATILLQYQRAYEATAKLIQTLDEMTQAAIGMLR